MEAEAFSRCTQKLSIAAVYVIQGPRRRENAENAYHVIFKRRDMEASSDCLLLSCEERERERERERDGEKAFQPLADERVAASWPSISTLALYERYVQISPRVGVI
jgi:hypothetical protein